MQQCLITILSRDETLGCTWTCVVPVVTRFVITNSNGLRDIILVYRYLSE